MEGSVVVANIQEGEGNYGFNAATTEYGDMLEEGIVDPTKVCPIRVAERFQHRRFAVDDGNAHYRD